MCRIQGISTLGNLASPAITVTVTPRGVNLLSCHIRGITTSGNLNPRTNLLSYRIGGVSTPGNLNTSYRCYSDPRINLPYSGDFNPREPPKRVNLICESFQQVSSPSLRPTSYRCYSDSHCPCCYCFPTSVIGNGMMLFLQS